jgi:hypothetical protein
MAVNITEEVRNTFLDPWKEKLNSLLSAAGHQNTVRPDIVLPGSSLEQARNIIVEVAFEGSRSMGEQEKRDVVKWIDWLLDLLAADADIEYPGWGAVHIPEDFWLDRENTAGVVIIRALEQCLGEDFTDLKTAAEQLKVDRGRLYHLYRYQQAFPVFYDPQVAHPLRRMRVRIEQVRRALKRINEQ